jgi:hypothetical protein
MKQIFFFLFSAISLLLHSQNSCSTAARFCTCCGSNDTITTNPPSEIGPNYGCLFSHTGPYWQFLEVSISGSIIITIIGQDSVGMQDIDFVCWGPFASLTNICNLLDSAHIVDCSYSTSSTETCTIPAASIGQFYVFVVTHGSSATTFLNSTTSAGTFGASSCTTGINILNFLEKLEVSPNPSNGVFDLSFECPPQNISIIITDILGRTLYTEKLEKFIGSYKRQINLTSFNKGIYFVKITGESGSETRKIIYH